VVFLNVPKSLAMAPAVTIGTFQYRTCRQTSTIKQQALNEFVLICVLFHNSKPLHSIRTTLVTIAIIRE